jgi:hypothetical protein
MKHLEEIVRELCWNSSIGEAYNYLANDRQLEVSEEDISYINNIIGLLISEAYFDNPFNDRGVNMNDWVDGLEEIVWDNYSVQLKNILVDIEK